MLADLKIKWNENFDIIIDLTALFEVSFQSIIEEKIFRIFAFLQTVGFDTKTFFKLSSLTIFTPVLFYCFV